MSTAILIKMMHAYLHKRPLSTQCLNYVVMLVMNQHILLMFTCAWC